MSERPRRQELLKLMEVEKPAPPFDAKAIETKVRMKLENWRGLLSRNIADGRQLLREVLAGPLRFAPEERQYRFTGEVPIDRILSGIVGVPTLWRPRADLNRRPTA